MRRCITLATLLIALVICGHFSNVRAQTPTPITNCQTFWNSGTYVLNTDLNVTTSGLPFEGTCFRFNVPNVTIDGQGHTVTITNGDRLVSTLNTQQQDHITIKNLQTNGSLLIRGAVASNFTIMNSTVNFTQVEGADDILVQDSIINSGYWTAEYQGDPSLRTTFLRNTVTGTGYSVGFFDAGSEHPCPRADYIIRDNTFTSNSTLTGSVISTLRIACSTHSIVTGNTVRSTGTGIGFYMRDESDDGYYENNSFYSTNGEALRMASGNTTGPNPKSFSSRNTFYNNTFRSDNSPSALQGYLYMEGIGSDNQFRYNTFVGQNGGLVHVISDYGHNVFDHNTFYATGSNGIMNTFGYLQPPNAADTWTNNIFSYQGGSIFGYDNGDFSFNQYIGNHNLFQNRSGTVQFGAFGASLSSWRTNSGNQDDMNSIEGNPLFGNVAAFDFTIAANSPARGAGSGGTDIGAKPYGSEPPPICTENWSCGAWSACSNSTQSRTCTDANNCGTTTIRPPLTQSCDSTSPTVSITAPTNGATVNGTVTISASASDNVSVAGVTFYANGVAISTEDTSAPYSVSWNTTGIANGSTRTLTAVARDASNNTATSSGINVTINPPICTENWSCAPFGACTNGTQSRTCTDANNCGTTNTRPPLSQSCVMSDTTPPTSVANLQAS